MSALLANKIYSFHGGPASYSADATLSSLTVDGAEVPGLDAARTEAYEFGVGRNVSQVTVAAVANHSGASVTYSVEDADMETEGHQIDLSRGRNEVTVTVTAENPNGTETLRAAGQPRVRRTSASGSRWRTSTR